MYESFYGLTEKPFSILPDPEFIYWGRAHRMAFAMMEYGILNRAGFTVITGEIGCGKTTLVRQLLRQLDDDVTVGLLSNTRHAPGELLRWIMMALGQPFESASYLGVFKQFQDFLIDEYAARRHVVLIIDEAQNLGRESLEELRMLSNINADKNQLLQLILVGQPQLKEILRGPDLKQFAQRISSDFHINPFGLQETAKYVDHRLQVAGAAEVLFSDDACRLIHTASGGIPRIINILSDTALVYGYAGGEPKITADIVRGVIADKREYGVFAPEDGRQMYRSELGEALLKSGAGSK